MTALAEAGRDLDGSGISEGQLLDVLYEVLAQGVPPKGELTTAEVERFLHEHARSPKPVAEMLAFFQRYGLPTDPGEYGADPELGELASGLHRERGPISQMLSLDDAAPQEPPAPHESGPMRKAVMTVVEDGAEVITTVGPAPRRFPWLLVSVCILALGLLGGFAASYQRGRELELSLSQARLQQRSTDVALSTLEQRAEHLKGALDQSEAERRGLSTRFDAFVAEQAQRRAAEEEALKRLLGPRYESLREKALTGARTPSTSPANAPSVTASTAPTPAAAAPIAQP